MGIQRNIAPMEKKKTKQKKTPEKELNKMEIVIYQMQSSKHWL